MTPNEKLKSLNIVLPAVSPPVAAFSLFVQSGPLVFFSGHIAKQGDEAWVGKLGLDLTTEEGKIAARAVAIDLMATARLATGDLNRIKRIVKLVVLVNSTTSFNEQHLVANGASELFQQVFGENGIHSRCAFGVAQIPLGSCLEIEMIIELE